VLADNFVGESCMPPVFNRTFHVRYYECDPYGHVNNANYLRYATQAAVEASADVGYDAARYAELGTMWFIREAGLEFLRPVKSGDVLNAKTWVSDFRRVRSRRECELTLAQTGETAATVYTDWVYLDVRTQQPARIPDSMSAAFLPESTPPASRREPFPEPPSPPPGAFTTQRRVRWHHLDTAGHMNSAAYLGLTEDVGMEAAEHVGWPMQRALAQGFVLFFRAYRIEFLRPAFMDEALTCTTYLSDVRRSSSVRHHLIHRGDQLIARARVLVVMVNPETGRLVQTPPEMRRDFSGQMVAGETH
jgi:acyl-CoA thioester hydrolase